MSFPTRSNMPLVAPNTGAATDSPAALKLMEKLDESLNEATENAAFFISRIARILQGRVDGLKRCPLITERHLGRANEEILSVIERLDDLKQIVSEAKNELQKQQRGMALKEKSVVLKPKDRELDDKAKELFDEFEKGKLNNEAQKKEEIEVERERKALQARERANFLLKQITLRRTN